MHNEVKIECLSKNYGDRNILNNIFLKIETGDIIGLYGKNGSGKSTLFSILFGTKKADNLILSFNNKIILSKNRFNKIFSLLPQFKFLPSNISVKKILRITIESKSLDKILKDDYLKETMSVKVSKLSTGNQRYLEALTVLYNNSNFCLLDEPFKGLSPILSEELSKHIISQSEIKGIMLTDHNYAYTHRIANKTYLLNNGTLITIKDQSQLVRLGYTNSF